MKIDRILWKEAWVPSPKACSLLRPFRGAVLGQLPRVQLQTHSKKRLGFREGSRSLWHRGDTQELSTAGRQSIFSPPSTLSFEF